MIAPLRVLYDVIVSYSLLSNFRSNSSDFASYISPYIWQSEERPSRFSKDLSRSKRNLASLEGNLWTTFLKFSKMAVVNTP